MGSDEARAAVDYWLQTIQSDTPLELDENGTCVIEAEPGLPMMLDLTDDEEEPRLGIYVPLLELPPEAAAGMMLRALSLNLYQAATRGGCLAFDPRSASLVYCMSLPVDVDRSVDLGEVLTTVCDTARALRDEIVDIRAAAPQKDSDTAPPDETDGRIIFA